ncbi:MAG: class I SAM-dependent methyltransferase [Desulfotignum sp.]|nr:class I SAM-dependent methyltransferase [Desulfotignum sp.]MCF8126779.1 class I SAM-dependent methyltransferase [Desulfotignum sp.]
MGYVFDFKEADQYDAWFSEPGNRHCLDLEIKLILDLMDLRSGQRVLDIGCGTGMSLVPLLDRGMSLTGVDPSAYMLDNARQRLGTRVDLHRCPAEDLPFEDNAFDTAFFFTSLEFTDRPAKAIEEACRVAKDRVVIGVLNRYAPVNICRRCKGFFSPSIYNNARFFSIWELKQMLFNILGDVPVHWRTTLQFPFFRGKIATAFENNGLVQKSFFGTFIGVRIKPVPKFRVRPLPLKIKKQKMHKPATGLVTTSSRARAED